MDPIEINSAPVDETRIRTLAKDTLISYQLVLNDDSTTPLNEFFEVIDHKKNSAGLVEAILLRSPDEQQIEIRMRDVKRILIFASARDVALHPDEARALADHAAFLIRKKAREEE